MLLSRLIKRIVSHKPAYRLRPVSESDVHDLHDFCWQGRQFHAVHEFILHCLETVESGQACAIVADYKGQAVGFGLLTLWPLAAEISDLVVAPAHQSKGLGTAIIQRLTDEAWQMGAFKLEIGAANSNPRAFALYKRLGFVPEREILLNLGRGAEPVTFLSKYDS